MEGFTRQMIKFRLQSTLTGGKYENDVTLLVRYQHIIVSASMMMVMMTRKCFVSGECFKTEHYEYKYIEI